MSPYARDAVEQTLIGTAVILTVMFLVLSRLAPCAWLQTACLGASCALAGMALIMAMVREMGPHDPPGGRMV